MSKDVWMDEITTMDEATDLKKYLVAVKRCIFWAHAIRSMYSIRVEPKVTSRSHETIRNDLTTIQLSHNKELFEQLFLQNKNSK
jgi:hypothetical protein